MDYFATSLVACELAARDLQYRDSFGFNTDLHEGFYENLRKLVVTLGLSMKYAEGDKSLLAQIESFAKTLEAGKERRPGVLSASLKQIILGVEEVLKTRMFMFIPADQAGYFMNLEHFGESVSMFPNAMPDMLEASNCFASGRGTACVFHSMRVAEHGLRHIAKQLGVKPSEKGKQIPVEFATWEKVLVLIENKRSAIRQHAKSLKHAARTVEYAGLADHIAHLKDLWRNPTMHSRSLYSLHDAFSVMVRVSEFMNTIAGSVYAPPIDPQMLNATKKIVAMTKELGAGS